MITVRGLTKTYDKIPVLQDLNTTVGRGEAIALVGPSGSGKSTLLRCLNFLDPPDSGEIEVDGLVITPRRKNLHQLRQKVGMVFQHFHLFPNMTVRENLVFSPTRTLNISLEEANETAMALLRRVGLQNFHNRYPARLSGGQKQRVAIARALAMNPQVMLFDEPTSALDPEMVQEVLDVIRDLHSEALTMLIVTHEMSFAREVSDRVWFLDEGRIVEDSDPKTFFTSPSSTRAQIFLGKVL